MSSELRVSRRANADPLIEELNVGDAAEPQGRGTGRPSLNCSLVVCLQFWGKSPSGADVGCRRWKCCVRNRWYRDRPWWRWTTGPAAGTWRERPAAYLRLQGHPGVCLRIILKSCLFKEVRNYKRNLHTFSGGCQQLAAGYPSHTVRILRPRSQGHRFYQSERSSHAHHRRRLRVPVWDGASCTFWFRYGWLYKPFSVTLVKLESLSNLQRQTKWFFSRDLQETTRWRCWRFSGQMADSTLEPSSLVKWTLWWK